MIVNGATSPQLVWGETVDVMPNTAYEFSMWVSSCDAISPANLDVLFNGGAPSSFNAPTAACLWQPFTTQWNSGSASSLTMQIYDTNMVAFGNDFALDDISLSHSSVPEPSTLVLLVAGALGFVGYGWRRRAVRTTKPAAFDQQDPPL